MFDPDANEHLPGPSEFYRYSPTCAGFVEDIFPY